MTDWIEHKGGACPVDLTARVDLKTRGGQNYGPSREYSKVRAHQFRWEHNANETDIIAYRMSKAKVLMSHDEAMEAIRGACGVSMLSYEEAIAFYFNARGMQKPVADESTLSYQLGQISASIQAWLNWQESDREEQRIETSDSTHMITLPVAVWPTRGMFTAWIKAIEKARVKLGGTP